MNANQQFQQKLLKWYDRNGRKNLPWQGQNSYAVWLSEIMLQQTQVSKVIEYYQAFVKRFANMQQLSLAKADDVLQMWSGLGYYNRAQNIHKTAKICVKKHQGELPTDFKMLMELPGIGRTTAAAILSLSADLPYAILDGNVKRVFSRVFKIQAEKASQLDKLLWQKVDKLMPKVRCKNYNQALMDLGSMVCKRTKPQCQICPLQKMCQAFNANEIEQFPQKKARTKQIPVTVYALLCKHNNKILLQQRHSSGIWSKLWFLPTFLTQKELNASFGSNKAQHFEIIHILSHRKLTIKVAFVQHALTDKATGKWVDINQLNKIPHPSALVKILGASKSLS